jgi:hypothetical protein
MQCMDVNEQIFGTDVEGSGHGLMLNTILGSDWTDRGKPQKNLSGRAEKQWQRSRFDFWEGQKNN